MNTPLLTRTLVELQELGLPPQVLRIGMCALDGPSCISVKEVLGDGTSNIVLVDLNDNSRTIKRPMKGDAAVCNPKREILAVRGRTESQNQHFIQLFDLNNKVKKGTYVSGEPICYWKWINDNLLIFVTDKAVYHWKVNEESTPTRAFLRGGKLAEAATQIIQYALSADLNWCLLVGISTEDHGKTIDGYMQLYCVSRSQQQLIEGHCGKFATMVVTDDGQPRELIVFCEKKRGSQAVRLHIMEMNPERDGRTVKFSQDFDLQQLPPGDFPVGIHISATCGVISVVTKGGMSIGFEALKAGQIFLTRISQDPIFLTNDGAADDKFLFVNRKGCVVQATVNVDAIIPLVRTSNISDKEELGRKLALRFGLPGADDIMQAKFEDFFQRGDYNQAAKVVILLKSGSLRTQDTLKRFKSATAAPGSPTPIFIYFNALLEQGKLSHFESVELVKPVVAQGRADFIVKWIADEKLTESEELGNLVKTIDTSLAGDIFSKCGAVGKAAQCWIETRNYDKVIDVANSDTSTDYYFLLRTLATADGEAATKLAKKLLANNPPRIDINQCVEILMGSGIHASAVSVLYDYILLREPDNGYLQTKMFELALTHVPDSAEALFQTKKFSNYDKSKIAHLCENSKLHQRALEHYSDLSDVRRIMSQLGDTVSTDWLMNYCSSAPPEACLEIISGLLNGRNSNVQLVSQVAIKEHQRLGILNLLDIFRKSESYEVIFYVCGKIIGESQDPEVHYQYMAAAAILERYSELERMIYETNVYDKHKIKDYLKELRLSDSRPLIAVCNKHGFIQELVEYLYRMEGLTTIENFVLKIKPQAVPVVIGSLMDLDCPEDKIKSIVLKLKGGFSGAELVDVVEKRNCLRLIEPWLDARIQDKCRDVEVHNAAAKVIIDMNRDPEKFLLSNKFYDPKVIGDYCEDRDPHLAVLAYEKAEGGCDNELIEITNKNGLFRTQAEYLISRQNSELWQNVLDISNPYRVQLVDQVITSLASGPATSDQVLNAVHALVDSKLPNELMALLEKLLLYTSNYSDNPNLQNLLLLTAIRTDPSRLQDYAARLNNYDCKEIAQVAGSDDYGLYEEAFSIYKKFGLHHEAIAMLLKDSNNLDRAIEYAERCGQSVGWDLIGKIQMEGGALREAANSFVLGNDITHAGAMIAACEKKADYDSLLIYLLFYRKKTFTKEMKVDEAIIMAYAQTEQYSELTKFLTSAHAANLNQIGQKLFENGQFKGAVLVYQAIPNNAQLSRCYLELKEYSEAVEAAKNSSSQKTWRGVCFRCLEAGEYEFAQVAALANINHPDYLGDVIREYEGYGLFEELIKVLEIGADKLPNSTNIVTELSVCYAKHRPSCLSKFINDYEGKFNIPRLIRACNEYGHEGVSIKLYIRNGDYDQAVQVMMLHPADAWEHNECLLAAKNITNPEIAYRLILFYFEYNPMEINYIVRAVQKTCDAARIVKTAQKVNHLPLIQDYLEEVASQDIGAVNNALQQLYIESWNFDALQALVERNVNFDTAQLIQRLNQVGIRKARIITEKLLCRTNKYSDAIQISLSDNCISTAIRAARNSKDQATMEDLQKRFLKNNEKSAFVALLCTCYNFVVPDSVMELAWLYDCTDVITPYMVQAVADMRDKLNNLSKICEQLEADKNRTSFESPVNEKPLKPMELYQLAPGPNIDFSNNQIGLNFLKK